MCRLNTSENLLVSIQDKIKWADNMSEMDKKHRKEAEEGVEELKKSLSMKVSDRLRWPKSFHYSLLNL